MTTFQVHTYDEAFEKLPVVNTQFRTPLNVTANGIARFSDKQSMKGSQVTVTNGNLLSNATFMDNSNTISTSSLKTTGANVIVSGSAPPDPGYVLMADTETSASWQAVSAGVGTPPTTTPDSIVLWGDTDGTEFTGCNVTIGVAGILQNANLTHSSNLISATRFRATNDEILISQVAPTAGQQLRTTGPLSASWQDPSVGIPTVLSDINSYMGTVTGITTSGVNTGPSGNLSGSVATGPFWFHFNETMAVNQRFAFDTLFVDNVFNALPTGGQLFFGPQASTWTETDNQSNGMLNEVSFSIRKDSSSTITVFIFNFPTTASSSFLYSPNNSGFIEFNGNLIRNGFNLDGSTDVANTSFLQWSGSKLQSVSNEPLSSLRMMVYYTGPALDLSNIDWATHLGIVDVPLSANALVTWDGTGGDTIQVTRVEVNDAGSFENARISGTSNTVKGSHFLSTIGTVVVSGNTPTAGQVLVASDDSTAQWDDFLITPASSTNRSLMRWGSTDGMTVKDSVILAAADVSNPISHATITSNSNTVTASNFRTSDVNQKLDLTTATPPIAGQILTIGNSNVLEWRNRKLPYSACIFSTGEINPASAATFYSMASLSWSELFDFSPGSNMFNFTEQDSDNFLTCRLTGLYMFAFHIQSHSLSAPTRTEYRLRENGIFVRSAYSVYDHSFIGDFGSQEPGVIFTHICTSGNEYDVDFKHVDADGIFGTQKSYFVMTLLHPL